MADHAYPAGWAGDGRAGGRLDVCDELAQLRAECDGLRQELQRATDDLAWWWERSKHFEQRMHDEQELGHWLVVGSPLTKHEEWQREHASCWRWRTYQSACPSCKRPLDVTLHRKDIGVPGERGRAPEAAQPSIEVPALGVDAHAPPDWANYSVDVLEGSQLRCCRVPPRHRETPLFASASSYDIVSSLPLGGLVVTAGTRQMVDGYAMLPVRAPTQGAVDARYFELVDKGGRAAMPSTTPTAAMEPRNAYCAVLWGCSAGYTLGAAVLGCRLQELDAAPARVLLHTDDVPPNFLDVLSEVWELRQVEFLDAVPALYSCKGTVFDGVFTKLAAWNMEEYDKVLLLDIDIIPLRSPSSLFELDPPAALVRGNGDNLHGEPVCGRRFFLAEGLQDFSWSQGGGINAGVILLRPSAAVHARMVAEVTAELHPEHIPGNGPEQDYLTRFFASTPWRSLGVEWNFQLHHVPFALEQVLTWRRRALEFGEALTAEDLAWRPPRLRLQRAEDIGIVHFSGDVKFWHMCLGAASSSDQRRCVEHTPSAWQEDEAFAEHLLKTTCEGYTRWVERASPAHEYEEFGCRLADGGRVVMPAGGHGREEDATALVDDAVGRLRAASRLAARTWRESCERLLARRPRALEELGKPAVPHEGCYPPGARVEIRGEGRGEESWAPAMVASVHADGRHVIRHDKGGAWGDTERKVHAERLRLG